ncbi:MAG: hypothetical protein EBQ56_01375 [Proteobacteria bacterium]|nr:hypothetical protein [Pseudomonadota bacterium]
MEAWAVTGTGSGDLLHRMLKSITGNTAHDRWVAQWRNPNGPLPTERDAYLCARLASFLGDPPNATQLRLTIADLRATASDSVIRDAYRHVVTVRRTFAPAWRPAPEWEAVCGNPERPATHHPRPTEAGSAHASTSRADKVVTSSTFVADNPGRRVVRAVYQRLQIDDEWSVWNDDGFTWWGHRFAQRIRTDAGRDSHGERLYRVTAEVDWFDLDPDEPFPSRLFPLLAGAVLSSYVRDPQSGRIGACLSANVHQGSERWIGELLSHAALVQLWEIEGIGTLVAGGEGFDVSWSEHPVSGRRERRDDIMAAVEGAIVPAGRQPSIWAGMPSEFAQTATVLNRASVFTARHGVAMATRDGLMAEVGVGANPGSAVRGGQLALISADPALAHPFLGNGVQIRMTLPVIPPTSNAGDACLHLGHLEQAGTADPHGLGSWCINPGNGCLSHVLFVPNLVYQPGLVMHLVMSAVLRAIWADGILSKPPRALAGCTWS